MIEITVLSQVVGKHLFFFWKFVQKWKKKKKEKPLVWNVRHKILVEEYSLELIQYLKSVF